MISIDKGLLGRGQLGDAVERHAEYGRHVEYLDIIVFSPRGFLEYQISQNVRAHPTNSIVKIGMPLNALDMAKKLFSKSTYDLIVAQDPFLTGWVGMKLKKKFGSRLIVHMHGDFFENKEWLKENWKNRFLFFLGKSIVRQADGVRVMSQGQKEKLLNMEIPDQKIRVISTPVNIRRFDEYQNENAFSALKERLKIHGIKKCVLVVARKDTVKDFHTLFHAMKIVFSKIPDSGLWLVGNYKENEVKEISLETSRVIITENEKSENLPAYYKLSDVVALSSTSESFGKALVEANACAKPVVATATTGAKEIIQDGYNGFLVPIGNAEKLAEKIIELLNNSELALHMGANGLALVQKRFDGEENTQKIIQFWKDVIKNDTL